MGSSRRWNYFYELVLTLISLGNFIPNFLLISGNRFLHTQTQLRGQFKESIDQWMRAESQLISHQRKIHSQAQPSKVQKAGIVFLWTDWAQLHWTEETQGKHQQHKYSFTIFPSKQRTALEVFITETLETWKDRLSYSRSCPGTGFTARKAEIHHPISRWNSSSRLPLHPTAPQPPDAAPGQIWIPGTILPLRSQRNLPHWRRGILHLLWTPSLIPTTDMLGKRWMDGWVLLESHTGLCWKGPSRFSVPTVPLLQVAPSPVQPSPRTFGTHLSPTAPSLRAQA